VLRKAFIGLRVLVLCDCKVRKYEQARCLSAAGGADGKLEELNEQ